ncbi:MAG: WHG domain-containing protein [Afipia sp.]|nr:WHG domain-containing protein [Afipia sp.]
MGVQNAAKREKSPKAAAVGKKPLSKPVSAKKISPSAAKPAHKSDRDQPYHHGDLHGALLKAAKQVAEREGINGLTLRAVAREAGVSHAAPSHHFGDVTGLLSELAAIGFKTFSEQLGAATCSETAPEAVAARKASAYVAFARENPCMFQLMFRGERLDHDRPALQEASDAAFHKLADLVAARRHEDVVPERLTLEQAADIARIWSMVHGFAMLYLDGRLTPIMEGLPSGTTEEALLAAMLMDRRPA